jgi:hypothetical protein
MEIGLIWHLKQNAVSRAFAITALPLLSTDYAAISGSVAFGPVANAESMASRPPNFSSPDTIVVAQNTDQ